MYWRILVDVIVACIWVTPSNFTGVYSILVKPLNYPLLPVDGISEQDTHL